MIVTLKNAGLTAQIDSLGAQLISLKDHTGTEYIWQRDPAYWSSCSPLLFPTVGNCRGGRMMVGSRWYEIPKHGFCRGSEFSVHQNSEAGAAFTICDSDDTRRMYPFAFRLTLTYTLTSDGLSMDYLVENRDSIPMFYELGAHPGFNCPLNEGERFEDYVIEFETAETASSMVYDPGQMQFDASRRIPRLENSRILPLSYELFSDDAVFFDSLASRRAAIKNPTTGAGVEVSFPDFETVAFWTPNKVQAPFVCVEPWNGSAIRSDEDDQLQNRHFVQTLAPAETKTYHLGIRILYAL